MRLVDGENIAEGRVELCVNNEFGTICSLGWDDMDASVACSSVPDAGFFYGENLHTLKVYVMFYHHVIRSTHLLYLNKQSL